MIARLFDSGEEQDPMPWRALFATLDDGLTGWLYVSVACHVLFIAHSTEWAIAIRWPACPPSGLVVDHGTYVDRWDL